MSDNVVLSVQQLQVISALAGGATLTAAAEQAGIHRNTITNWRRTSRQFEEALSEAHYDRAMLIRERMAALVDQAFETLQSLLADPKAPASVRLKAALSIINIAAKPPEPRKRPQVLPEVVETEQPHNPAQPVTQIRGTDTCPCGSGKKFKRCCIDQPHPAAA